MKKVVLLFLLLAFVGQTNMKAQAPSLSIGQIYYALPDSVNIGGNYPFSVSVINSGNAVFTNNIVDLYFAVDSSAAPVGYTRFDSSMAVIGLLAVIPVGDSIVCAGSFNVSSDFCVGNNTVVIWPLARFGNVPTIDSLILPMFVVGSILNSNELVYDIKAHVFPNPTTGNLFLDTKGNSYQVRSIVVRDIFGRIIKEEKEFPVNLDQMESGVYFIDLTDNNGKTQRFKIVKSE